MSQMRGHNSISAGHLCLFHSIPFVTCNSSVVRLTLGGCKVVKETVKMADTHSKMDNVSLKLADTFDTISFTQ